MTSARWEWLDAVGASSLPFTAKAVAAWLSRFMDDKARAYPSRATLARTAGCSVRTVERALGELEATKWLYVERLRGRGNLYTGLLPTSDRESRVPATESRPTGDRESPKPGSEPGSTNAHALKTPVDELVPDPAIIAMAHAVLRDLSNRRPR